MTKKKSTRTVTKSKRARRPAEKVTKGPSSLTAQVTITPDPGPRTLKPVVTITPDPGPRTLKPVVTITPEPAARPRTVTVQVERETEGPRTLKVPVVTITPAPDRPKMP